MKENIKKYKIYIIISLSTLILLIGGTLAYYIWKSSTNAIVNLDVCTPTITFAGGSTINGVDILPVLSKEDGTIKDIEVSKKGTCTKDVTMNLYLELTTFPTELSDSSFKYELYKNNSTSPVANGNFANKKEGDTITLLSNTIVASDIDNYTLYIYIDGNMDNPIEMAGKSFLFKVWGAGEGAIYKENVITTPDSPSSSSSKFFNTEVMREEINTLTIADNNKVPEEEGVISKDISSNQDGTVMLWYTPKEVTGSDGTTKTMYDMWIGGENGVLQTGTNASGMFAYLTNVEKLDLSKLDTSYITNMSNMFYNSSGLKEIDLSNFNTSNVTNMSRMFDNCSSLTSLDVSSFDTSKVTDMLGMFEYCSSLESLDLSNFDTSKVTKMGSPGWSYGGMFQGCTNLKNINLSSFDTSNVTLMGNMFYDCKSLGEIDLSNFDTSNVTDMSSMFKNCTNLQILNLNNFNTSNVISMTSMFEGCTSLIELDLSSFDTLKVKKMAIMFYNCSSLTNLDLSNFNTQSLEGSIYLMFANCSNLINLNISNFSTSKVTNMGYMFYKCKKLLNLNISNFDVSNVTNMEFMFNDCSSLTELDLSNFDVSNVTNMNYLFIGCSKLKIIYVSNLWNISRVTASIHMFTNCFSLNGSIPYDSSKTDVTMANYTTGYLTYKANTN